MRSLRQLEPTPIEVMISGDLFLRARQSVVAPRWVGPKPSLGGMWHRGSGATCRLPRPRWPHEGALNVHLAVRRPDDSTARPPCSRIDQRTAARSRSSESMVSRSRIAGSLRVGSVSRNSPHPESSATRVSRIESRIIRSGRPAGTYRSALDRYWLAPLSPPADG